MKKILCAVAMIFACYGFWGSLCPDLTFVEGTYAIVGEEQGQEKLGIYDAEAFYADLLEHKYHVSYRSKLWELIQNRYGHSKDERITE